MDYLFDDDIYTNEVEYFFSLHGPRFEYMNTEMAKSLGKKFGKEFRPIRILNAWPAENYKYPNYIILNKRGYELAKQLKRPVVYLPDYEDVNVEFAQSPFINQIAQKLLKKQKTVFLYPFTTSFLDPDRKFTVLGPSHKLATEFDSKVSQVELFKKLNLPRNRVRIFKSDKELLARPENVVPSYISAAYTSGGNESGLVYTKEMLLEFLGRLRKVNKQNPFLVSEIFENIVLAPNVNSLITADGRVYILAVTDQILHGNRYLGNHYPTRASVEQISNIYSITLKIGMHMASKGYQGLFGCDFLINKNGRVIVIDLNPRHQGGYVVNDLMLATKGISLTNLELATFFKEPVELSQPKLDEYIGFAWSHSKLLPHEKGESIKSEVSHHNTQTPFSQVGSYFAAEFYQKGSVVVEGYVGYAIETGTNRSKLARDFLKRVEKLQVDISGT